jgi:protein-tyrosine kinase
VLSTLMGQIVLVVKAGTTPQQAVRDALELLGPERDISLILNHAEVSGPLGYYYGYGYGYRNYGETDGSASSAAASAGKPTGVS